MQAFGKRLAVLILAAGVWSVVSAQADGQWQAQGVTLCALASDQFAPQIMSDGLGGAMVVWQELTTLWAQRVDSRGQTLWAQPTLICSAGLAVCDPQVVSDQSGGMLVLWRDFRNGNPDLYIQRVDSSGNTRWAAQGAAVCTNIRDQQKAQLAGDGAGGAIITWEDLRLSQDIYAQRVDSGGNTRWANNGIPISLGASVKENPQLTGDGAGGALIAWDDLASGAHVLAQHVDSAGNTLWAANGIRLCTAIWYQAAPKLASDGAGGAIVVWQDSMRGGLAQYNVYGMRVDGAGNTLWASDGVMMGGFGPNPQSLRIESDEAGGAWVGWVYASTPSKIRVQRFNASGTNLGGYSGEAIPVTSNQTSLEFTGDGSGGLLLVWQDDRNGNADLFGQRINASGQPLWPAEGVALCTSPGSQNLEKICSDGAGGVLLAWQDGRGADLDIYAQRILRPWPRLTQATPNRAVQGKTASGIALGGYLRDDRGQTMCVALHRSGYASLTATVLTLTGDASALASFDLTGAAAGVWDLAALDSLGQTATAAAAFTVFPPAARSLTWLPVPAGNLYTGTQNVLAGQINGTLDGYDRLQSLQVVNLGTAEAETDILRLGLWYQSGGGSGGLTFDAAAAQFWGAFTRTGAQTWTLALSPAQEAVAGSAWYLTADISGSAQVGRTLRLSLAPGSAVFQYGNTLPAAGLFNPYELTIARTAALQLSWIDSGAGHFLQGQTQAALGTLCLRNLTGSALSLKSLRLGLTDTAGQAQDFGRVFHKVRLMHQGAQVAETVDPVNGTLWTLGAPLSLPAQGEMLWDVNGDVAGNPTLMDFKLALPDGACVNQGELLAEGAGGQLFPLLTAPLHVRAPELSAVFSVYPNPLPAGQGAANVVYYLRGPGRVKLAVRTLQGALVKTLIDGEAPAGLQTAAWDGGNERGQRTLSGVYRLMIEVKYADGTVERLTRKLALVR